MVTKAFLIRKCRGGRTPVDNTAPTITSVNPSGGFAEGIAIGGTLTADEVVAWSKSGTDAASVTLNPATGEWFLPPTDYETKVSYTWTFRATDLAGNGTNQVVAITITDVDEVPPTITSNSPSGDYIEHTAIGGTLTANETVTWSKTGVDASRVSLNGSTGVWTLEDTEFDTKTSYTWSFIATDTAGNQSSQSISITITDSPTGADFTVSNWSQLNALIGNASSTDLTGKTMRIAADCNGAAIQITNRTWPGLVIFGDLLDPPLMPRLRLNNVKGGATNSGFYTAPASGQRIVFRFLDFYNVAPPAASGVLGPTDGQITFDTNTSSWLEFDNCKLRDDPFSTKSFRGGFRLQMYWGLGRANSGLMSNVWLHDCEISNAHRSICAGDNITTERIIWHDHYIHAATIIGSYQIHRNSVCYNLWANANDTGGPHAGIAFSPACDQDTDTTDIIIEGIVALAGTARNLWSTSQGLTGDDVNPAASGVKFNDAANHNAHYVRCEVRNCLLIGNDTQMVEFDSPVDCKLEFTTLVHDRLLDHGSAPTMYLTSCNGMIVRHNIVFSMSIGSNDVPGLRGTGLVPYNNFHAHPTSADSLLSYENMFVGLAVDGAHPNAFSSIASVEEALACFALNPTHPAYSATIKPGATTYYDWDTGVGDWPASSPPVSNNSTTNTPSLVTKPSNVWNRSNTGAASFGAWTPANKRKFTIVHRFSTDTDVGTQSLFTSSTSPLLLTKLSGTVTGSGTKLSNLGAPQLTARNASSVPILNLKGTIGALASMGVVHYVISVDLDKAKALFAIAINGTVFIDFMSTSTFILDDFGLGNLGRTLTFGAGNTTTPSDGFSGQQDVFLMEDQFLDIETDAGFSKVFNTSGGLPDLGSNGQNVFGSTPAIFLKGNAAAWNGANFNLGDATGSTGSVTATKFAKGATAAGSYI